MILSNFYAEFDSEEKAVKYFKSVYESVLKSCKNCRSKSLRWNNGLVGWKCSKCSKFHSLKSLTFMKDSNLKFLTWLEVVFLLTETKKTLSISEITRLISIDRYKTVFYMVQKIRKAMGEINLSGFYQKRSSIDIRYSNLKLVPHLSLFYGKQDGEKMDFIRLEIPQIIHNKYRSQVLHLKGSISFRLKKILLERFKMYEAYPKNLFQKIEMKRVKSSWERKIRSNFLRELKGIYHHVSLLYFQNVLDEYCFKYNYRNSVKDKFKIFVEASSESR